MKRYTLPFLVLWLACSSSGSSTLPNPLVRLDFKKKLPEEVRKRAPSAIELDCNKTFTLSEQGAQQKFVANWRLLDIDSARYIVAIDVAPVGTTSGAGNATASGSAGELERKQGEKGNLDQVLVTVSWKAQKGCTSFSKLEQIALRSDDPSCKSNAPKGILKPVK